MYGLGIVPQSLLREPFWMTVQEILDEPIAKKLV
jgi:hypothetical protein